MDILLHQNVPAQDSIEPPVTDLGLLRRHSGSGLARKVTRQVVALDTADLADGAVVDPPDHLLVLGRVSDLKSDMNTLFSLDLRGEFLHLLTAAHVGRDRL